MRDAADTTCWRALDADKLRDFAALSATLAGDEDAATLYAMVRETQFFPTHEANVRAVRVSSYEQLCGCGYRALYVTGCVDGFMPARDAFEVVSTDADRDRVRKADRRTFAAGVAKATDALMFSTFSLSCSSWPSARRCRWPACAWKTASASPPCAPPASWKKPAPPPPSP